MSSIILSMFPLLQSSGLPLSITDLPTESVHLPSLQLGGMVDSSILATPPEFLWALRAIREGALKLARNQGRGLTVTELNDRFSPYSASIVLSLSDLEEETIEVCLCQEKKRVYRVIFRINPENYPKKLFCVANIHCTLLGSIQSCLGYLSWNGHFRDSKSQHFVWASKPSTGVAKFLTEAIIWPITWGSNMLPIQEPVGTKLNYMLTLTESEHTTLVKWDLQTHR